MFGITNSPQSPDIWQNSDVAISDFWSFGQSLIKENCHNSRTSDDIDMTSNANVSSENIYAFQNCRR